MQHNNHFSLFSFHFSLAALAAALLCSCGGGGDDPEPEPTPSVTVSLSTQSIAEGAEVDAKSVSELQFTYSVAIKVAASANITLNGTKVTATRMTNNVAGVQIPLTLEEGVDYTLIVPSGSIIASADASATAPEFKLNFKTKAKAQPVNPDIKATLVNGNEVAQKLYDYMREQYGQKTISSVMADVAWNHTLADKVKTLTGKYPAMNCYDFIHIQVPDGNGWIDYSNITPVTEWTNAGGIVQLMWHFNVPYNSTTTLGKDGSGATCTPGSGTDGKTTNFSPANALKDGAWENKFFYEQMDRVASVILKLQDAGIAATWRPFHEAAGNATAKQQASWTSAWFWWGIDGADTYRQLWQAMFKYFKEKGIKNLIWVWTTQNYNGNSANYNQDTDWYPGDEYVDMVARDLYGYNAALNAQEFTEIQAVYPTKMVVLGECGKGESGEQGLIGDCWTQGAQWGHFMVWYQGGQGSTNTMCSDSWWKNAMSSEHVITRDQLPSLK